MKGYPLAITLCVLSISAALWGVLKMDSLLPREEAQAETKEETIRFAPDASGDESPDEVKARMERYADKEAGK